MPTEQYTFAGYGTPADALQSHYWALENPSSGKLLETLALPPEVRNALPRRLGGAGLPTVGAGAASVVAASDASPRQAEVEVAGEPLDISEAKVAVVTTLSGSATLAEGIPLPDEDVMEMQRNGAPLGLHNGHRVISETEIDANTREMQVERELADGTTRTETQRVVRVGDEWKVQPGGNVRVLSMPGGAAGVLMESSDPGSGSSKMEMRIEQSSTPGKP